MNERIPAFEGIPVEATEVKMSGAAPVQEELEGTVIYYGDLVQMTSHFRCVGVHHREDNKTGKLVRVQVLRPVLMALTPFDPTDPNDTGIMRAQPRQIAGTVTRSIEAGGEDDGEE